MHLSMEHKLFALLLVRFFICELHFGYVSAQSETQSEGKCNEKDLHFSGKVIIVTGASSGIGADAAKHLAKNGASVSLVGRNVSRLNGVSEQIKSAGAPTPLIIVADVTIDAQRIIDETINYFGKLDVLINCAGIMAAYNAQNVNLTHFDLIIKTNVRAPLELTKYAIPYLEKTKGNILNVASIDGMMTLADNVAYGVSKAALIHLTESVARDMGPKGIRVNGICPGMIRTPIFQTGWGLTKEAADKYLDENGKLYPVGRAGYVSDTSAAIEFLISEYAAFITGTLLTVDGGSLVGMVDA